ncbi:hypothetical protein POM88_034358 [Heracleum sosnowskyi]|uniref:Uncharacterized protein n=1 Tax=Heracleum sosnowskyi TaxID=360622 RepID=A0AAD8MC57_9APIA|nr:hypothetical protein POM88_034358 [Heracleum sosnowskyi]
MSKKLMLRKNMQHSKVHDGIKYPEIIDLVEVLCSGIVGFRQGSCDIIHGTIDQVLILDQRRSSVDAKKLNQNFDARLTKATLMYLVDALLDILLSSKLHGSKVGGDDSCRCRDIVVVVPDLISRKS